MKVVSTLWTIWGAASLVSALTGPTIHVEQGAVKGTTLLSAGGRPFQAFQGIPYGKAPVGKYRFKEPVPAKPWVGVWPAERPGSPCLQYMQTTHQEDEKIVGSEDCLYLNVYTPKLPGTGKPPLLDVIVYIHGGAFMFGWGHQYGPKYYMDRDVVYVTLNYRLGVLGFLSTEDEVVPGNNGLKDQVLALKWLQRNIAAFGGNPDSVTISGTSAGGASVHYHYFSPMSRGEIHPTEIRTSISPSSEVELNTTSALANYATEAGLFHRGMSYSGNALCPWTQAEGLRSKANLIAASLGCQTGVSREMVACLRKRPAEKIVALTKELMVWLYNPFSPFGPTVEVAGNTPFLTNEPLSDALEIKLKNLPWLTSLTTEEGLYPAAEFVNNKQHLQELNKHFVEIAPFLLDYNYTVPLEQQPQVTEEIRNKYFGDLPIGPDTVKQLVKHKATLDGHLNDDQQAASVPPALLSLVCSLLHGYASEENVTKATQPALTISQLIVFIHSENTPKGNIICHKKSHEPPVPLYVCLSIFGRTRNNTIIESMHKRGLSISPNRIMEITASLAHLEIKRAQEGVLCPSNLLHGLFVIGAYDNMYHNYSSTTSESYYHGKAISIFQIPGEGEVGEPRNFATSISCVDQSNRKATELPDSYNVVKTVTLPSKQPPVSIASKITCF
uniref:Carboxylic ester hydrolase n=1 Tax=Timema shepardi TaxID=629360 RepID=A0A7R9FYB1_TIMSH|nr:unnamed protein product [Timema shepardi]